MTNPPQPPNEPKPEPVHLLVQRCKDEWFGLYQVFRAHCGQPWRLGTDDPKKVTCTACLTDKEPPT